MKKYISACIIALTTITMVSSCKKAVDVVAVGALLPGLQLSSVGMQTSGPYVIPTGTTVNTIQVLFGATTTGKNPGAFDVTITDATTNAVVETLHFASWTSNDSFGATSMGSISYTTVPSSYPNTTIYQGSIILKYTATTPFVTGKTYTVKAVASSSGSPAVTSTITVAKLISIQ
ncbi:hypothetical protein [Mucilaginibacter sp.]|uniref:hypothetical protein n=1 Tax=Mucilaginibacter sp. TaxID=1882438 RepID=UPI00261F319A|nr:hypothetical protein [Mucilaginibacter sp.]MDB5031432.1 hypothetical protein [Mucilaginibacter sp.]